MKKPRKAKLITPFFTLLSGAITIIILTIRDVDLFSILVTMLVVMTIFYFVGDVIRYIYEYLQPRVISLSDLYYFIDEEGKVVERTADEETQEEEADADDATEENAEEAEVAEATKESEEEPEMEAFLEDDEYSEEDLSEA